MARLLIPILIGIVVVVGGGVVLLTVVHGRDAAGIDGAAPTTATGPGSEEPDRGAGTADGAGVGEFSSPAPTSGEHERRTPTREGRIDDATLLTALALGDVALVYGDRRPPRALRAVQDRLAGPFDPELAAAGQAILLVRREGTQGVQALAWRRRLAVADPADAQLGDFAQAWLGRGAAAAGG